MTFNKNKFILVLLKIHNMSWITEALTATNGIKDPFIKFLIRAFLLLIVVFALYLSFALVTHKKIIFNNGTYEIVDAKTADSIAAVKSTVAKPQFPAQAVEHRTVVIDTEYKNVSVTEPRKQKAKITNVVEAEPPKRRSKITNVAEADKEPTKEAAPNPADLTESDKSNITRKISELQNSMPNQRTHVSIFYTSNDNAGGDCAYKIKSYLIENGYDVNSIHGYPDNNYKNDVGFYIGGFFHPRSGDAIIGIWVGILKPEERPCTIVAWK